MIRLVILSVMLLSLTQCNTLIGVGRDIKGGYHWSAEKIQNARSGNGGYYNQSGAPVY